MAIVYQVSATKDYTSKKVTITDDTGNYSATNNTTGYGAPNATRASRALFVNRYYSENGIQKVASVATVGDSDPTTDSSWAFTYTKDECYAIALLSIDALSIEPSVSGYSAGEYYYNTVKQKIFQNNGGEWEEVTEIDYDNVVAANKAKTDILLLDTVNDYLRNDFIANIDQHTIKITRNDIELLKALKDCANDDFVNKNYLSVQESLDEIDRVIKKLT